jgi:carboxymethylenebutenolidase
MTKRDITIETSEGPCPAGLFLLGGGKPRGSVILYMDAFGPRPALDGMAERLAGEGYAVLLPDLFHRQGDYGPFDAKTTFSDPERGPELRRIMGETTQAMSIADTAAFLDVLAKENPGGGIGVVGYCMGGARALNAAAAYPDRIAAAASFHGGNLASDKDDSPHLRAADLKARVYIGVSGVDRSFPPEQSARLAQALREAEVDHIIENYVGMAHGWTVPDHGVYDAAGAERHWTRLLTFFDETLRA